MRKNLQTTPLFVGRRQMFLFNWADSFTVGKMIEDTNFISK